MSEGKAIRKTIAHSAPGRLEEVCNCIRVLTGGEVAGGSTAPPPAWVEADLATYCLEYLILNQVPISIPGEEGANFVATKYNHVHSLLAGAAGGDSGNVTALAKDVATSMGCVLGAGDVDSDEAEAVAEAFLGELFIRFSDHGPQVVRVKTTTSAAVSVKPLGSVEPLLAGDTGAIFRTFLDKKFEADRYSVHEAAWNILHGTLAEDATSNTLDLIPVVDTSTGGSNSGSTKMSYVLAFTSEKINSKAGWSGRWASTYKVASNTNNSILETIVSDSTIRCHVHSNEEGNVQLNSTTTVPVDASGKSLFDEHGEVDPSGARGVFRAIRRAEATFSEGLEGTLVGVSDSAEFKALRRKLPVSKQLFDFDSAVNSAAAQAASSLAAAKPLLEE